MSTMVNESEYLLISGIKHFRFCRRRWALIHIEQQWEENALTVSGHLMHEAVHDAGFTEKRGRLILSRGMPVRSDRLRIQGVCDMVELIQDDQHGISIYGREGQYCIYPVEYKKGSPDVIGADIWHLCAEALCLEEMFVTDIPEGAIYYGALHRRITYPITPELRQEVTTAIAEMNEWMIKGYTPQAKEKKACRGCSMYDLCRPELAKKGSVQDYIERTLQNR